MPFWRNSFISNTNSKWPPLDLVALRFDPRFTEKCDSLINAVFVRNQRSSRGVRKEHHHVNSYRDPARHGQTVTGEGVPSRPWGGTGTVSGAGWDRTVSGAADWKISFVVEPDDAIDRYTITSRDSRDR